MYAVKKNRSFTCQAVIFTNVCYGYWLVKMLFPRWIIILCFLAVHFRVPPFVGLTCILYQLLGKRWRDTVTAKENWSSPHQAGLQWKRKPVPGKNKETSALCGACQYIRHRIPFSYKNRMRTGSPDTSVDISLKFLWLCHQPVHFQNKLSHVCLL